MSAIGINASTRDREYTWADVRPNHRPDDPIRSYALQAWKEVARLADLREDGLADQCQVDDMIVLATELQYLAESKAECSCTPRNDYCRLCKAVANWIYREEI